MLKLLIFLGVVHFIQSAPQLRNEITPSGQLIVGGQATLIEYFPYQVLLIHMGHQHCGGSILSPSKILTAAHCTHYANKELLNVRAGSSYATSGGVLVNVAKIIEHEFNPNTINNDIALLFLETPLQFGPKIMPILLPEQDETVRSGTVGIVSGWGLLSDQGAIPDQLHYVALPVVDDGLCKSAMPDMLIPETMLCAGNFEHGGVAPCNMDSGGPLVINGKVQGVVSWGIGCGEPGFPSVFTRVSRYRNWIDSYN